MGERYVRCVLLVETRVNGVKYRKPYITENLDWDYFKSNNHIYGLIEGMNVTSKDSNQIIQKLAGDISELYSDNFALNLLTDFKDHLSLKHVYSEILMVNIRTSSADFHVVNQVLDEVKKDETKYFQ